MGLPPQASPGRWGTLCSTRQKGAHPLIAFIGESTHAGHISVCGVHEEGVSSEAEWRNLGRPSLWSYISAEEIEMARPGERHSAYFISHKDGGSFVTHQQDDDAMGCVGDNGTIGWVSLCGRPLDGVFQLL